MSDKKEKLEKENIESEENKLNGDSVDQAVSDDSETDETTGTPSYEELFDKNEELEKLLLRANADLDNALKRTLSEVVVLPASMCAIIPMFLYFVNGWVLVIFFLLPSISYCLFEYQVCSFSKAIPSLTGEIFKTSKGSKFLSKNSSMVVDGI